MLSQSYADHTKDKMFVADLRRNSNTKANGTSIKTLIAQEMSKEVESKHNPPNLVAKLMGLDTLPKHQSNSATQSSHSRDYSCWEQDFDFFDRQSHCEDYWCDDYEIWQQPQKKNHSRENSPHKGKLNSDNINEKKMALIRQKFMEAKRLSTDVKLRESKEFHDALEILSSNRDVFLRFLQESNSIFSQHRYELRSVLPPETKRITLLKPAKVVNNETFGGFGKKTDKEEKNPGFDEYPLQATRIVVLKPSPGKNNDVKAVQEHFYEQPEEFEAREVAKEITRKIRETLTGDYQKDETLRSSVYSNGYIGDDSSFNRSENDYTVGNLSDSEFMSPTLGHSWDGINRVESPYSSSAFSRLSCSPESSVCREAKKRLFERWAMMASNRPHQEHRPVHRSSSTLGEMLTLNKEPRGTTSCLLSDLNKEDCAGESPNNLLRSKSLPVSSTVYGARLNVEVSNLEACKAQAFPKELTKAKSLKSTFRGKVSSLFFSKNKKSCKENSEASQLEDDSNCAHIQTSLPRADLPGEVVEHLSCFDGLNKSPPELFSQQDKGVIVSWEGGFPVPRTLMPGNVGENQDQPSPISVLEPPFEDDSRISESCSNRQGALKSNLIDKSPPIGSIARTLSWDDSTTPYPSVTLRAEEEEQDWLFCIQTLLSAAGFEDEMHYDAFLASWHSPESPLDPSLRDQYANRNEKEAQRRWRRSNQKLVFDCVNAALIEITGSDRSMLLCIGSRDKLADRVWAQIKEWFGGDNNSLAVEMMVRKEVASKCWAGNLVIELENVGKEIEGELIQELVEEAVADFTSS